MQVKQDQIHIVVDSIAVAGETALKDDPRCHELKLIVRHGDLEWQDGEKTLDEMFDLIEASGKLPSTSQPPIGKMLDLFMDLSKQGKKIVMITVDSVLSGTYQTACVAAKQVMDEIKGADIRIIDGRTAACPLAGMALEVLKAADNGATMDELEKLGWDMVHRTETYFSVNTLDYLQKGGRIGAVGALIGNIFGIRPIIHLDKEGRLEVVDKCRTRKKVLKRMIELAASEAPLEAIYVANAQAPEDAKDMEKQLAELFPGVPTMVTSIGTVLAAHLGPGVIGVFVRRKA